MTNIELLEDNLKEWGTSKFAYAYVGKYIPEEFKGLNYAISVAVRLSDAIINQIQDKPTHTYFHHYRSVNTLIDNITLRTMLLIEEWGFPAIAIPASQTVKNSKDMYTGVFQHKTAAVLGGMGWIGKSALLVTPEYGPRVRLGTVLTSMELPVKGEIPVVGCGDCCLCRLMCPAMAIHGNNWHMGADRLELVDAAACSIYMNENFKHIGRGSVCGICMRVCPAGRRVNR